MESKEKIFHEDLKCKFCDGAGEMYMREFAGNSLTIEDAMSRSMKDDLFEQKIISILQKAKELK